mgnify:CR=1 FL=1|tara:strand:+ start:363 stop:1037 length:675 start_codon:yes stop_codon:yes gene_type:complete
MKIYNYKDDTRYVTGQRVKQDQVRDAWVKEDVIDKLSKYLQENITDIKFGICHGARLGDEVYYFNKYLSESTEVIGTELFDYNKSSRRPVALLNDFAKFTREGKDVICNWDFHNIKDEWIDNVDFIYTNSFDHSDKPELALDQWMKCLKKDGILIVEKTMIGGDEPDRVDCLRASDDEMKQLFNKNYKIIEELDIETKYETRVRDKYLNLSHTHWIIKHKESDK